jgi:hypothetical protein
VGEKVKMIKEIESGRKKADMRWEIGLVNFTVQTMWKNTDEIVFSKKMSNE